MSLHVLSRRWALGLLLSLGLGTWAWADRFNFGPYGVGFDLPHEFTSVPFDQHPTLAPANTPSLQIIANPDRSLFVSYQTLDHDLTQFDLGQAQLVFEAKLKAMLPGLVLKKGEFLLVDKEPSLHFEFESKDGKGVAYFSSMFVTARDKQMVLVIFRARLDSFKANQATLRASADSLSMHDVLPKVDPDIFNKSGKAAKSKK